MQFYLASVRPSADGKSFKATITDRDFHRFVELPEDVKVIDETENGNPIIVCPKDYVRFGNILEF